MAIKVVDASAMVAFLFDEPEAPTIAEQIEDHQLAAPAILGFELANACATKIRRVPEERVKLEQAFAERRGLGVIEHAVALDAVVALAAETRLTAYDASYLWLARRLGAELVTLDRQLLRAYAAMGRA